MCIRDSRLKNQASPDLASSRSRPYAGRPLEGRASRAVPHPYRKRIGDRSPMPQGERCAPPGSPTACRRDHRDRQPIGIRLIDAIRARVREADGPAQRLRAATKPCSANTQTTQPPRPTLRLLPDLSSSWKNLNGELISTSGGLRATEALGGVCHLRRAQVTHTLSRRANYAGSGVFI